MTLSVCRVETPIGILTAESDGAGICSLTLTKSGSPLCSTDPILLKFCQELSAYFAGTLKRFTVPITEHGTPFQLAVWQALRAIPYGETRTYGEIAALIGRPGAARAVGSACRVNPLPILTPCHRAVGTLHPDAFALGAETKRFLLRLESSRQTTRKGFSAT